MPTPSPAHTAEPYSQTHRCVGYGRYLVSLNGEYSLDDIIDLNRWLELRRAGRRIIDLKNELSGLNPAAVADAIAAMGDMLKAYCNWFPSSAGGIRGPIDTEVTKALSALHALREGKEGV